MKCICMQDSKRLLQLPKEVPSLPQNLNMPDKERFRVILKIHLQ